MAVRKILILTQTPEPLTGNPTYRYLVRADVPAARAPFFAKPGYVSPFTPLAPDTDPDAAALVTGTVVERIGSFVATATLAQIRTRLVAEQAQYQSDVTADPTYSKYGSFFDGNTWTVQGV